jgi:hypothetical protein
MRTDDLPPLPSGKPRPASLAWITDELLTYTQDVWSKEYGRPVTEDEAIEMLVNVKRLGEVILKVANRQENSNVDWETVKRDIEDRHEKMAAREPWEKVCNIKERVRLKKMYGAETRRRRGDGDKKTARDSTPAADQASS